MSNTTLTIEVFKNLIKENQEQKELIQKLKTNIEVKEHREKEWRDWYLKSQIELKETKKELLQTKKAHTLLIKSIHIEEKK